MQLAIFQINLDRDEAGVAFDGFDRLCCVQGTQTVNSAIYDRVYEGETNCNSLEDVYTQFNIDKPDDYHGRSLSVSDIVQIVEADSVAPGFYYCDSIGFRQVDFEPAEAQRANDDLCL